MNRLSAEGRAILAEDPVWAAYAIADLRPDLARYCRWAVSPQKGGLVLLFTGLEPPILLAAGTTEGVHTALGSIDLPPELSLSVQPSHLPAVQSGYPCIDTECMLRMRFAPRTNVPLPVHTAVPLSRMDLQRLQDLYRCGGEFAPDAFDSSQLDDGYFFGIEDKDGSLLSAGGTHIAYSSTRSPSARASGAQPRNSDAIDAILAEGVAAIGNVYTRPDSRGKGYGTAVTASILHALQVANYGTIVLNVSAHNLAAQSIYEKLGFSMHCHFLEGRAATDRCFSGSRVARERH